MNFNIQSMFCTIFHFFRELESLNKIHDTSLSIESGIWEEFEKGCAFNEKLSSTRDYLSQYSSIHNNHADNNADITFHSRNIKVC